MRIPGLVPISNGSVYLNGKCSYKQVPETPRIKHPKVFEQIYIRANEHTGLSTSCITYGNGFVIYSCDLQVMKAECQDMFKKLQKMAGESLPEPTFHGLQKP